MTDRYLLFARARADLDEIRTHTIARWGIDQAEGFARVAPSPDTMPD
jgi:plasmid stabilization system protein ParE